MGREISFEFSVADAVGQMGQVGRLSANAIREFNGLIDDKVRGVRIAPPQGIQDEHSYTLQAP
jgi:hypothetical protein